MPIYEYRCRACDHEFEAVVLPKGGPPTCPDCASGDHLERLISLFAVSSDGTRETNLKSARKQAAKVRRDKQVAEHEAIHHHHH